MPAEKLVYIYFCAGGSDKVSFYLCATSDSNSVTPGLRILIDKNQSEEGYRIENITYDGVLRITTSSYGGSLRILVF